MAYFRLSSSHLGGNNGCHTSIGNNSLEMKSSNLLLTKVSDSLTTQIPVNFVFIIGSTYKNRSTMVIAVWKMTSRHIFSAI